MEISLKNKVAIVTGGTRGIGYAIVKAMVESGAKVAIWGSRQETADTASAKIKEEYRGNTDIERIWELCVNTQRYGVQEVIQDCMEREKGFYLGDGCYTALTHMVLTGDDSMTRKLIDDAFASSFITEGLVTCMDCSFMQ